MVTSVTFQEPSLPQHQSFVGLKKRDQGMKALVTYVVFAVFFFSFGIIYAQTNNMAVIHEIMTSRYPVNDDIITIPSKIKRPICPSTHHLFRVDDDMASLTSAYLEAENFHNGGGNMKTIDMYLNAQMDKTFVMLDIKFKPKGSDEFLSKAESTTDKLLELYKANDIHKRGGYDQRQPPGLFKTSNTDYYNEKERERLDVIEPHHTDRWLAGLGPKFEVCKRVDKIGKAKKSYEDKFMCSFEELRNNVSDAGKGEKEQCGIISIGSNGQWGFEESIAKMTNCTTHTFDCTVKNPRKPNIDSIHFYPYCVSATNMKVDDREFMTYSKIIEQTGMTKPPTLFKMDVEGFEFDVMAQMLDEAVTSGTAHLLPSQISVELHYATRMFDVHWKERFLQASEIAMFMGMMYRRGGYVPVNVELIGPGCYSCAEVLFVRLFCD